MKYSHNQGNQFEPLTHLHDRKSRWFASRHSKRRRAREHKRKELVELQLASLDAELSTRFDHVIRTNEHNSNVQLPDLDLSPMQMVKWQPPALSPVRTPTPHFQPISDADWSTLEIKFSAPARKTSVVPCPSPPMSIMTAAELGLLAPLTPKVCLPELTNRLEAPMTPVGNAPIVMPWMPCPSATAPIIQSPHLTLDATVYDGIDPSFVAAKLPHFHDIDPFDLAVPSTFDASPSTYEHLEPQPQSTRCTLYRGKGDHHPEEPSLNTSQSLRTCEEGRMPGVVHNDSATVPISALEVDWSDESVEDWAYDIVGDWDNEPFVEWGEPFVNWDDKLAENYSDDLVMIEHDAETYDWTFLSSHDRTTSDCISDGSSAFSSVEILPPLTLRDSFLEDSSAYEGPPRELADDGSNMRRVSKSAWESESDFCIPAFF
ncbi:unnamed protein product [Aureobasidium uvarum]|uniref:Uncharacterized protein n=1 Tax=Aureobasidium uvarum TaxID=2773716 RepID=A0A9N8KH24_9PEZI|nr:unnamed protein product [Aureobasidium uvarum]